MKLGIAGYGYVGQAMEELFKDYHEIIISDPNKNHYGDLRHADAVIICVSTPGTNNGYCDVTNVGDVIEECPDANILIKSTISIEGWKLIVDCCKNKNLTFSPEFLRAKTWKEDILNTKDFYFGGANANYWIDLFRFALGKVNLHIAQPEELIVAKQLRNSFLATKVSFFNQALDLCSAKNINYEQVRSIVCADERIGDSHSTVTSQRGFGGHCFPKDVLATIRSGQVDGVNLTILEEVLEYNKKVRNESRDNI